MSMSIADSWRSSALAGQMLKHFGRPSGLIGSLAGWLMSRTAADDRWVVDLLDVQPEDRVLDVGCGPGVTLAILAQGARDGLVVGVDPSPVMLRQASRRNRDAVREGRVELRLGDAVVLPYPDAHFSRACAVHSVYFWSPLEHGVRELRRVLAPGGRVVLAVRLRHPHAAVFDPSRYGLTDEQVDAIVQALESEGFQQVTTRRQDGLDRQTMLAILARR